MICHLGSEKWMISDGAKIISFDLPTQSSWHESYRTLMTALTPIQPLGLE